MGDDREDQVEKMIQSLGKESEYTDLMRSFTTDAHGNRVRVGLSMEETAEFNDLNAKSMRFRLLRSVPYSREEKKAVN